jgi:two-component system NtrC family sensor kinase
MLPKTLKFKVSLYLTVVLSAMMLVFITLVLKHQRAELESAAAMHVTQLAEVVARSTRFAMLKRRPMIVDEIVRDIGHQRGIERVRILDKNGAIASSSLAGEKGVLIDDKAEPCVICHEGKEGPAAIKKRWRTFKAADGREMLASMEVILNEPSCASANCHNDPQNQSVLGVVDITYSLEEMNQQMARDVRGLVVIAVGFILFASVGVGLLLHRLIYLPLKDLERGAQRVSEGHLESGIPVRGNDEFGRLAGSFNMMTGALKESHRRFEDLVQTLEQKVRERTRELRIAEAEVIQGEKLAAVGQMAAGIAHELNSPLTGVLTFTQLLRNKTPQGPDAEDLDLVIRETKRCAAIIRRLLDFARQKTPENQPASLNKVIEETVRLVERSAALQRIEIATQLDPQLPELLIDPDLIKQVLMNMLVNSQQAIGEGGRIQVSSHLHADAQKAEIVISDTGCGIPPENLPRIFDPFFTSKEVGKGTGLGLSVSYGIVRSHGGEIRVESTVGEGTTFRVYLPIKTARAAEENTAGYVQ